MEKSLEDTDRTSDTGHSPTVSRCVVMMTMMMMMMTMMAMMTMMTMMAMMAMMTIMRNKS